MTPTIVLCECIVQRRYLFFVKLCFDNIMSIIMKVSYMKSNNILYNMTVKHTCQVTRFRRVTPGNQACHPHFPEHPSGHGFHYDVLESPGICPDIRNIYLFGKYRDFTY